MKTLFTLITFLGLGLSVPIFADHTPDHKCDCTEECAANCKAHNEKSADCECTHCECAKGKDAKTDCVKCHNKTNGEDKTE